MHEDYDSNDTEIYTVRETYTVSYSDGTVVYRGNDLQAAKEARSVFYKLNAIGSLILIWVLLFRITVWPLRAVYRGFIAGVREFWRSLSGKNKWGDSL